MTIVAVRLLRHQAKRGHNDQFSYDDMILDYLMFMLPTSGESGIQQASKAIVANT